MTAATGETKNLQILSSTRCKGTGGIERSKIILQGAVDGGHCRGRPRRDNIIKNVQASHCRRCYASLATEVDGRPSRRRRLLELHNIGYSSIQYMVRKHAEIAIVFAARRSNSSERCHRIRVGRMDGNAFGASEITQAGKR